MDQVESCYRLDDVSISSRERSPVHLLSIVSLDLVDQIRRTPIWFDPENGLLLRSLSLLSMKILVQNSDIVVGCKAQRVRANH